MAFPAATSGNLNPNSSSSRDAPAAIEVSEPSNRGTHEDRNYVVMYQGGSDRPAPSEPVAMLSDCPSSHHRFSVEQTHEPATTRFQRNSSGYPIDSDPDASVV